MSAPQSAPLENLVLAPTARRNFGLARRLYRHGPPLPTIRSLHYFTPAIEEILRQPLPAGYLAYLEHKIATFK